MKRILVVVDGTTESNIAVEYAVELASAASKVELLLLNIREPLEPWQERAPKSINAELAGDRRP